MALPVIDSSDGSLKADYVSPLSSANYLSRGEGSYTLGFFASSISRALIEPAIVLGGEPVPISYVIYRLNFSISAAVCADYDPGSIPPYLNLSAKIFSRFCLGSLSVGLLTFIRAI